MKIKRGLTNIEHMTYTGYVFTDEKKQDRDKKLGLLGNKHQLLVPDGSTNLANINDQLTTSLTAKPSGDLSVNQTEITEKKSRNLEVGEVLRGHV